MNKPFILRFIYILPCGFIVLLFIYINSTYLNILKTHNQFLFFNKEENARSVITTDARNNLKITYKLAAKKEDPYAGVAFVLNGSDKKSFNKYDKVFIKIKSENDKIVPIVISETLPKVLKNGKPVNERLWTYDLPVQPGTKEYEIPIKSFKVIFWWLRDHDINMGELPEFKPHNVQYIAIQSDRLQKHNIEASFTVIDFKLKKTFNYYWFLLPLLLSIIVEGYLFMLKKKKTKIEFQPILVKQKEHKDEWGQIKNFIAKNYHNENLQLAYLNEAIGINKTRISQLIRSNLGLSFKQYLNQIRIHEATRLLNTTELNISEIAFQVGFSNVSHFNRVFKELKSCSPTDFRANVKS